MKQKVGVRAIIKQDNKILLVRRTTGRTSLRGLYELPGGSISFGDAPEVALRKHIKLELGVTGDTVQLDDVLSELDAENSNVQHIALIYATSLIQTSIELSDQHDKYIWKKTVDIQLDSITSMTALALGITQFSHSSDIVHAVSNTIVDKKAIVYSDGGSRGNPGPSASGYVVMNAYEQVLYEGGEYIGFTTNNQAEYRAVLYGLQKAYELGARNIEFRMDSLLIVNQLNGTYKIKSSDLIPIHESIKALVARCERVHFVHVRREFNKLADGMVNKLLDAQA
jgi:ribonuclease HI